MSLIFFPMSIVFVSHVAFKKWPNHPVEFKGQGTEKPQSCTSVSSLSLKVQASHLDFRPGAPKFPSGLREAPSLGLTYTPVSHLPLRDACRPPLSNGRGARRVPLPEAPPPAPRRPGSQWSDGHRRGGKSPGVKPCHCPSRESGH